MRGKQLVNITHWGNVDPQEVRIEIAGNGHYIRPENLADWIRANPERLALEILGNINRDPEVVNTDGREDLAQMGVFD